MIKIIEKEVKIVKEYDVEPKVVTLYYVNPLDKDIFEFKNCIFKAASPISANDYLLEYENKWNDLPVKVDIKTGKVKDCNGYFFDYEQAVRVHRKRRIEFLKDRIVESENRIKFLEKDRKELEDLENFEKKGGKV